MARPPYSLAIPARYTFKSGANPSTSGIVSDGYLASEASSGVTRHKPTGWIAPTGYSMTYRSYTRAQGICKNIQKAFPEGGQTQVYEGCVGGSRFNSLQHFDAAVLENAVVDTSLANLSLIKARVKLKQSDINLGVAFAERKRTAQLLGSTASRMAKSFNNLKRGRVRAAMRDLGIANSYREPRGSNIPKKWLELQYGWKPLISDIYGACSALSRRDSRDWRVTAKAQVRSVRSWSASFTDYQMGLCVATAECGAFTRIDALPSNELTISLSSLGITNPLLIAWELVPYSFVVDWCLPVGTWLESLDALLGFGDVDISTSVLTRARWLDVGRSGPAIHPAFTIENNYVGTKNWVRLTRNTSGDVLPTFPPIKDGRSLGHMANGLALLAQAFGRR